MKKYEEFKEEIMEECKKYGRVILQDITKANICYEGLTIKKEEKNVGPILNLNWLYKQYVISDGDYDKILLLIEQLVKDAEKESKDLDSIDINSEKLYLKVINRDINKEYLKNMPHLEFQDLAIILSLLVSKDEESVKSINIQNEHLCHFKESKEELFEIAKKNTLKLFPFQFLPLSELAGDEDIGISAIIITNDMSIGGAVSIIYSDLLDSVGEKLGVQELMILPSSVNDIIVDAYHSSDEEYYRVMVKEMNFDLLGTREFLSNNIYVYNTKTKEITTRK